MRAGCIPAVIVSLTALVLVYCKHPYASHYLSFPLSAVTPSQHVALGNAGTFVDAHRHDSLVCTYTHARQLKQFSSYSHANCPISFSRVMLRWF